MPAVLFLLFHLTSIKKIPTIARSNWTRGPCKRIFSVRVKMGMRSYALINVLLFQKKLAFYIFIRTPLHLYLQI